MRVDVSEVKSFRGCKREWELSSRNRMHIVPRVTPKAFSFGTIFHEALHALYLGSSIDKVMETVRKEMDPSEDTALLAMVPGYAKVVLPHDLDRFTILDIEHKFCLKRVVAGEEVDIVGSIDMIAVDDATNEVWGFEHKTAKVFRDATYLWMDEQPRLYTVALKQYIDDLNAFRRQQWLDTCTALEASGADGIVYPEEPIEYTLGGIYINEVKKLLRDFQYQRTPCVYPDDDLENFMESFYSTVAGIVYCANDDRNKLYPSPTYFRCQMCSYKTICSTYMYSTLDASKILDEFSEEFKVREVDHLDEKVERNAE